jgi:carboxymethylenebutenolidase
MAATDWDLAMGDVQAAIDALAGPVFAMGFCYGGTAAWMAAARCEGLAAVSCFYGGGIAETVDETPRCPIVLHFGKRDELIPLTDVEAIKARHPEVPIWLYEAGHAFMAPSDYDGDSARLARLRTLQLFHRSAGKAEMGG